MRKLNQFLPQDIVILSLREVNFDTHARFDAFSRSYQYHIALGKTPFENSIHYCINQALDIEIMNQAAKLLLEYQDFECFSKSKTDVKTFLCDISYAHWSKTKKGYIFTITANRFLRNMVRAIVGTLLDVGTGKITIEAFGEIIKSKKRSNAGLSVPAQGLYLTDIQYPKETYSINGKS